MSGLKQMADFREQLAEIRRILTGLNARIDSLMRRHHDDDGRVVIVPEEAAAAD